MIADVSRRKTLVSTAKNHDQEREDAKRLER